MGTIKKFEDIEAWQRSCRLAVEVYKCTFQAELKNDWGLKDQLRRASISISSNIAEGFERDSDAEFKKFLVIAKGSCGELRSQLYIIKALKILPNSTIDKFIKECSEISSMLQSLISYLKSSTQKR